MYAGYLKLIPTISTQITWYPYFCLQKAGPGQEGRKAGRVGSCGCQPAWGGTRSSWWQSSSSKEQQVGTKGRQAAQRPAGLRAAPCCLAVQALADCSQISYVVTVFLLGCWLCTLKKISLFASLWNISSRELTL